MPIIHSEDTATTGTQAGSLLDDLKWRPIHTRITLVLGLGWMLDAFEVNIVGSVLGVLQKLWQVTTAQAALLVSVWLIGIMIGALLFGYFADRFGRRKLFILTLVFYATFTVISAVSPGYYAFLAFRFLTAIGVGAEYSAINAAIGELMPARYRGRAAAMVMNFWPLGSILAAVITLYFINILPPSVGWRLAFALGAVVALFSVWARRALPESPRWLAGHGRYDEAAAVSSEIAGDARLLASEPRSSASGWRPASWISLAPSSAGISDDWRWAACSISRRPAAITGSSRSFRSWCCPISASPTRKSRGSSSSAMSARRQAA